MQVHGRKLQINYLAFIKKVCTFKIMSVTLSSLLLMRKVVRDGNKKKEDERN